jgi:ribonuclease J
VNMDSGELRIIPIGGLGEIGKNMMLVEHGDAMLIIDAGMMFPDESLPGIGFVVPDFSYVVENRDRVQAILLTHGHEDHIGSLPFLLKEVRAPIYGTKLTIGFARNRLEEHTLTWEPEFVEIRPRQKVSFGAITAEFFRVCHSVADGVGIGLHTPFGLIVHSGDFKFDYTPIYDHHFDFYKIAEFGEQGVLLLMSDSTNAEHKGYTPSERELRGPLFDAISSASGRVLIATFASNVHRIQQICDVCRRTGKKICILGRSMEKNVSMARELGYLDFDDGLLLTPEKVASYKRSSVVLLTTGSQGEPMSALSRIANSAHPQLHIESGDTVILSASIIPGNEKTVSRVVNSLFRKGAHVIYEGFEDLHVSGHAAREELKLLMAILRPRFFLPIHGEFKHLMHHAEIAKEMGVDERNIILAENGDVVTIDGNGISLNGTVKTGSVFIDGRSISDIESVVIRDRHRLAEEGILIVVISISLENQGMIPPEIFSQGFIHPKDAEDLFTRAKELVFDEVRRHLKGNAVDQEELKTSVTGVLKRFFTREMSRSPIIVPIVVEV